MARSTVSAVHDTIDTTLDDALVDRYLNDASLWVDEELAGEGLSAARLELIERYLAAHFITLQDPRIRSGTADSVSEVYQRQLGAVTEYLRAAAALDTTGRVQDAFIQRTGQFRGRFRVAAGFAD